MRNWNANLPYFSSRPPYFSAFFFHHFSHVRVAVQVQTSNLANICLFSSQSHFSRVKISLKLKIVSRRGPSCTNRGQFDLIASKNASSEQWIGSEILLLYIHSKTCACFFLLQETKIAECARRRNSFDEEGQPQSNAERAHNHKANAKKTILATKPGCCR